MEKSNYQRAKMGCGAVVYPQGAEKCPDVLKKTFANITTCEFVGRKNGQQGCNKAAQFRNPVRDQFDHLFFNIFINTLNHVKTCSSAYAYLLKKAPVLTRELCKCNREKLR